jgi:hypothetical protein
MDSTAEGNVHVVEAVLRADSGARSIDLSADGRKGGSVVPAVGTRAAVGATKAEGELGSEEEGGMNRKGGKDEQGEVGNRDRVLETTSSDGRASVGNGVAGAARGSCRREGRSECDVTRDGEDDGRRYGRSGIGGKEEVKSHWKNR